MEERTHIEYEALPEGVWRPPLLRQPAVVFTNAYDNAKTFAMYEENPKVTVTLLSTGQQESTRMVVGGGTNVTFSRSLRNLMKFPTNVSGKADDQSILVECTNICSGTRTRIGRAIVHLSDHRIGVVAKQITVRLFEDRIFHGKVNIALRFVPDDGQEMKNRSEDYLTQMDGTLIVEVLSARDLFNTTKDLELHEDPRTLFKAVLGTLLYFLIGVIFLTLTQTELDAQGKQVSWTVIDALYFCTCTLTTVGYGDLVMTNLAGRVFVCIFIVFGIGIVATAVSLLFMNIETKKERSVKENIKKVAVDNPRLTLIIHLINTFGFACLVLLFGFFTLWFVDNKGPMDAAYAGIVTLSTVGYGDVVPSGQLGKALAIPWIFSGTFVFAKLVGDITDYFITKKIETENKRLLKTAICTEDDIKMFDEDGDGRVTNYEFLVKMLLKMKLVKKEDIERVMLQFQEIDVDGDGELTIGDFLLKRQLSARTPDIKSDDSTIDND